VLGRSAGPIKLQKRADSVIGSPSTSILWEIGKNCVCHPTVSNKNVGIVLDTPIVWKDENNIFTLEIHKPSNFSDKQKVLEMETGGSVLR